MATAAKKVEEKVEETGEPIPDKTENTGDPALDVQPVALHRRGETIYVPASQTDTFKAEGWTSEKQENKR